MNKLRQLLLFLDRGASQRLVEREVGINRRTIISYLNRINQAGLSFKALLELDDHEIANADQQTRQTMIWHTFTMNHTLTKN